MARDTALVIDVGTGGAKCILFDLRGRVLLKAVSPLEFRFEGSGVDFDPQEAWRRICALVREMTRRSEKSGWSIATATSTSMREGNVFYDSGGNEVLAVPNIDSRARGEGERIAARFGDLIYETSGHWPNGAFLASRLKLFKGKFSSTRIRKASMINDWVAYRLSGVMRTEPTNGCETALFDVRKRRWSDEIAEELKIGIGLLPDVVECGTTLGNVTSKASRETSLPESVEVIAGAADTEAALLGANVVHDGEAGIVAGTTTPVQAVVDAPVMDRKRRTWTCCHAIPGKWVVESNAGATGMAMDWWSRTTQMPFAELDREAARLPPGSGGVRAFLGSGIFNARIFPALQGRLVNITPWIEPQAVARAIIEGTCYAVRGNLEQLDRVLERFHRRIAFCGGAAKSDLWVQVQTNVLNRRVDRFGVGDTTARGAAILSFVASGRLTSVEAACSVMANDSDPVSPLEGESGAYETLYRAWLDEAGPPLMSDSKG